MEARLGTPWDPAWEPVGAGLGVHVGARMGACMAARVAVRVGARVGARVRNYGTTAVSSRPTIPIGPNSIDTRIPIGVP